MADILLKRAYEPAEVPDGYRVLVDRLWPRGVTKEHLQCALWLKEVAPSSELRQWFGHDPARFGEFSDRYLQELAANPAADELLSVVKNQAKVTLVYAAADQHHNHALVLQGWLQSRADQ